METQICCAKPNSSVGVAASISKTVAAPIERVKLLIQNQGAMLAAGRLSAPYKGMTEAFVRTYKDEGLISCMFARTLLFCVN